MKEFCIIYDNGLHSNVLKLRKKLIDLKEFVFCHILKGERESKLVIATYKNNEKIVNNLVVIFLNQVILCNIKKKYLVNNIKLLNEKSLINKILITALKNYDLPFEEEQVYKGIKINGDIHINSYLRFKMSSLIKKWQEMCKITIENHEIITNYAVAINLIKFLMSKSKRKEKEIKIEVLNNKISRVYYNQKGKLFKNKDLICFLVDKNPVNIKIKNICKFTNQVGKIFSDIFNKKIIKDSQFVDKAKV